MTIKSGGWLTIYDDMYTLVIRDFDSKMRIIVHGEFDRSIMINHNSNDRENWFFCADQLKLIDPGFLIGITTIRKEDLVDCPVLHGLQDIPIPIISSKYHDW